MRNFVTTIGFADQVEVHPDVWEDKIVEMKHSATLTRNIRRLASGAVNENITLSNQLSVLSNPYAVNNFHKIRYATYLNSKWKVTSVEVEYPRMILTLGGIYNVDDENIS